MNYTKKNHKELDQHIHEVLSRELSPEIIEKMPISRLAQEISIYHQELEYQNQELHRIQNELMASQSDLRLTSQKYHSLFYDAPSPYITLDKKHRITSFNKHFLKMLQQPEAAVKGTDFKQWVDPSSQDDLYYHLERDPGSDGDKLAAIKMLSEDGIRHVMLQSRETDSELRIALMDVTREHELQQQAKSNALRYEAIVKSTPVGFFQLELDPDKKFSFSYISSRITEYTGVPHHSILEDPLNLHQHIIPEDRQGFENAVAASAENLEELEYRFRYDLPDEKRWFLVKATPEKLSDGSILWNGIFMDIHRQVMIREELKAARENAEAANRAKDQFLANMSHEFRTPLNGVMGVLQMMESSVTDEGMSGLLQHSLESCRSLVGLIEDILGFVKLNQQLDAVHSTPFNLHQLLQQSVSFQKPAADVKNLALELNISPDLPVFVSGDAYKLKTILHNLVGNAIKFTEAGFVKVRASLEETKLEEGVVLARIEVEDSGIGISKEDQQLIFQHLTQADDSNTRKYGGVGIGLSVTQKLIDVLSGHLELESQPGEGSRFILTLPLNAE